MFDNLVLGIAACAVLIAMCSYAAQQVIRERASITHRRHVLAQRVFFVLTLVCGTAGVVLAVIGLVLANT